MRRRSFITLLGGAAAWPVAARAQQSQRVRRIGVMGPPPEIAAVGAGYPSMLGELQKVGFTEQRNLMVEYRVATQDPERVFADAAELVREKVDLLAVRRTGAPASGRCRRASRPRSYLRQSTTIRSPVVM